MSQIKEIGVTSPNVLSTDTCESLGSEEISEIGEEFDECRIRKYLNNIYSKVVWHTSECTLLIEDEDQVNDEPPVLDKPRGNVEKKNKESDDTCTFIPTPLDTANNEYLDSFDIIPNIKITEYLSKIMFSERLMVRIFEEDEQNFLECTIEQENKSIIQSKHHREIGGLSIDIQRNIFKNIEAFISISFTHFDKDASVTIISQLDTNLRLIDEKRTERLICETLKVVKSLHVIKENDEIKAHRAEILFNDDVHDKTAYVTTFPAGINLLLDGGSFVLMRMLVVQEFVGTVNIDFMHIEGDVGKSFYTVLPSELTKINGTKCRVTKIIRSICYQERPTDISFCEYLQIGHLLKLSWQNCRYDFCINPLSPIPPNANFNDPDSRWRDELQLMSFYLKRKKERKTELRQFLLKQMSLKSILQDYVLCLIYLKPDNILHFTIDYFTRFEKAGY